MSPKLITMVSTSPVQSSKKTSSQSECVSLRVHVCPAVCVRYRESARERERERNAVTEREREALMIRAAS